MYGNDPEEYDVSSKQPADLVVLQFGGNDWRDPNNVPGRDFYHAYVDLIDDIHSTYPNAVVLVLVCVLPFK